MLHSSSEKITGLFTLFISEKGMGFETTTIITSEKTLNKSSPMVSTRNIQLKSLYHNDNLTYAFLSFSLKNYKTLFKK